MISFVGAGPGAPDLLTLRAAARLAEADVVVWAASLVPSSILDHCRSGAEIHNSKAMTLEEVTAVYAAHPDAAIVRLHSGDPTIYSAIAEQVAWCEANGRAFEVVPGVSSLSAAAAAAGQELTVPAVSQSVVVTRLAHRTQSSMPEAEGVAGFARHGTTMAVFLSAGRPDELQGELLAAESRYRADTPAIIASRVSWPDERLVRTTVGHLAEDLRTLGATATVLVLVGPALGGGAHAARSHVYSPSYAHTYRPVRPPA
ncbi:MAG: precorrin-4 C(11)-methyltransferase [Acidimicrobiales bacterium]